jgi:integrase
VVSSGKRSRKRGHGEGTIEQWVGGRWRGRLMVGYRPDGRPDRRAVYGKTRAECQSKLDELRRRAANNLLAEAAIERESLAVYLTRWLEITRSSVRPRTHHTYGWIVRLHLVPGLGCHRLTALKPDHVQRFYVDRLAAGLSPRSVHHCHAVLHRALEQAVRWGYVPRNVCDIVDPPRVPSRELVTPNPEQLSRLLDTADAYGDRLSALWTTAVYTGCRKGELLGLRWGDVNLDKGTLTVRRALIDSRGGVPRYAEPKSAQSRRTVSLPADAVLALRAHRDRQNFERQRLEEGWSDYGLVFASEIGTPLDQGNVTRRFKAALSRARLPLSIRFHDLRHASATAMLEAGIHPKAASARLGHSQIGITMDLYAHVMQEMDAVAAEKLGSVLRRSRAASV